MYFGFCVYPGLNMLNEVELVLTYTEGDATENRCPGGIPSQGFRFLRLALCISYCFFATPVYSVKNSPENTHFMQTSANHHQWTVQVLSIKTIYSL